MASNNQYIAQPPYEDFSDINNAPEYRKTPEVVDLGAHAGLEQTGAGQTEEANRVNPLLRRQSTNYSDALELERYLPDEIANNLNIVKGLNTKPMHHQLHKRDLQGKAENLHDDEAFYKYDNVEMGDKLVPVYATPRSPESSKPRSKISAPSEAPYGITFCDNKTQDHTLANELRPRPPLKERRSSLFEDYKKDMYNQQHLFSK
ncbi:LANO_0G15654g1_1 [Lachancea nothofagi CBS 11611]|uniref:LANO_0G15654g1_1 n=1 Tax=Lachancea nothofagi CBS 11611 TaxID=1266666 RepID=A0A1G4KK93_9SACH|nr:LANO_0G15654g1_1 [Lachancea nothofagi CBS 11611]